jgi:hypothetical protein
MTLSVFVEKLYARAMTLASHWYWIAISGGLLLTTLITGINIPNGEGGYQLLSKNPFITRFDLGATNYYQEDILFPLLAYFTHMTSRTGFLVLCFVFIYGSYILFAFLARKSFGPLPGLIFSILLITYPLTTMLLAMLGMADPLSYFLTVPLLFITNPILIGFLSFLGVCNHPMMLLAMPEVILLRFIAKDEKFKFLHLVVSVLGAVLGYLAVRAFLLFNNIHFYPTRLSFIGETRLSTWINIDTFNLPLTWFSLQNIHWLALFICFLILIKHDRRYLFFFSALLLLNYIVTLVVYDVTRVYALISWGLTFHCLFHCYRLIQKYGQPSEVIEYMKALTVVAILSFAAPRIFIWAGHVAPSPFDAFYHRIGIHLGLFNE